MKKNLLWILLFLLLVQSQHIFAETVILGQTPAPSPDGKNLAFSYRGDLWLVAIEGGGAHRLTVHQAYESTPCWSPEGTEIAFASSRNGNNDIFVMKADGSALEQLTYLSVPDVPCDWTPDGKQVLFSSRRDFSYPSSRLSSLYQVNRAGSTPGMFVKDFGAHGKISPDGRYVLFTEGRLSPYRKHYHGSMNTDIWRYDRQTDEYLQLTDFDGNDLYPMWSSDGKLVYYISHSNGTANIWQMAPDGSAKKQLTFHKDDGPYFAQIARHAPVIAYTRQAEIWILNLKTGKYKSLKISVPADLKTNVVEWKSYSKQATEMAVSPNEKYIGSIIHGEVFISKNKKKGTKKAVRLTHSPAREKDICWVPGADTLLFVSDRAGNDDIFMVISDEPGEKNLYRALKHKQVQLTKNQAEDSAPQISPDGKKIAFFRDNDLWIMNRNGKNEKRLVESWNLAEYAWSPDSKWIAYSMDDNEFNTDIFIIPAASGTAINISRHPDIDFAPVWSPDGKKLGFSSRRANDTYDIWYVFLQKADHEKTKAQWEEEEELKKEAKKDKKKDSKKKAEKIVVKIDFENIHKRLRRATSLPGDETGLAISPDGKTFIFRCDTKGKNDLWSVRWDGKELKQLTDSNEKPQQIQWSKDGKKIYYLKSGGSFVSIAATGKDKKGIGFQAKLEIDHQAERMQMFHEAWRVLNLNFYDPKFHGIDWPEMRKKYGKIVEEIATSPDFNVAIRLMLGELNASHLGIYSPSGKGGIRTGVLGLWFSDSYSGKGLKVSAVMPDGPCDQAKARVLVGEILLAIDGQQINTQTNIHQLLNQKIGEEVLLTLQQGKEERELTVKPISTGAWMNLEYKDWVEQKRRQVDEWSKGKLGYVHIRGMGWSNMEQFQMELFSEAYLKKGLIIDVRYNGGGWINDYLLTMLQVRPHAYTIPRGGGRGYPQARLPYYAWTKPIAALCNQYSYSNAEIFSHAVKVLKLGKLIGEPSPGAVISTGGTRLLDGSSFRIPFRGWYNLETGLNQENNGAIPDYIVKVQHGDEAKKIDRQLKKSVEVLLEEVAE